MEMGKTNPDWVRPQCHENPDYVRSQCYYKIRIRSGCLKIGQNPVRIRSWTGLWSSLVMSRIRFRNRSRSRILGVFGRSRSGSGSWFSRAAGLFLDLYSGFLKYIMTRAGAVNTSNSIPKQDFFGSFTARFRSRSGSGSKSFGAGSDSDLKILGSAHHCNVVDKGTLLPESRDKT